MKPDDLGRAGPGAVTQIAVTAPGRLHLGFLDPDGTLGRRFGSIGLAIDGPSTRVAVRFAAADRVDADPGTEAEVARAREHVAALRRLLDRPAPIALHLREVLPAHAGLGSGTQLALAVARAFTALHGIERSAVEMAHALGRGRRSGIGIAAFEHGGLLVDGGVHSAGVAPLLARVEFPRAWRVLLAVEPRRAGLHGAQEARAIASLEPMAAEAAARLSHLTLMKILPAAHEADFPAFARGVTEVQATLGAHFAPAQGGSPYTSDAVRRLVEWLGAHHGAAAGQSSWGPTGFAIFPSEAVARRAVELAREAGCVDSALSLQLVSGRNQGALLAR